jgi:lysyl-tRNA synthetase, class II
VGAEPLAGAGADVMAVTDAELRTMAERIGVPKVATLSRPKVLDEMFQALVESKIDTPTFVVDYPKELSPLAKPKRGGPEGSPSASNCSRAARNWRTPSPS